MMWRRCQSGTAKFGWKLGYPETSNQRRMSIGFGSLPPLLAREFQRRRTARIGWCPQWIENCPAARWWPMTTQSSGLKARNSRLKWSVELSQAGYFVPVARLVGVAKNLLWRWWIGLERRWRIVKMRLASFA